MTIYCLKPNMLQLKWRPSASRVLHDYAINFIGQIDGYSSNVIIFCTNNHTCTDIVNHSYTVQHTLFYILTQI